MSHDNGFLQKYEQGVDADVLAPYWSSTFRFISQLNVHESTTIGNYIPLSNIPPNSETDVPRNPEDTPITSLYVPPCYTLPKVAPNL